ncbi:lipopolysaccharide biosynthesis protein [Pectobacterium polaris]|uniref:lipopolysaccharide biosynthesis protein n=1 Tax=Pectobacterium polaris TaxID=2042057 RepID=UPI0023AEB5C9|nr:lipopolysaccharide biosynthesis protein [Pectobacterium polaris]MDE8755034.1 lipopolysaccharide biosynthesis protein [Pectobacterium polaris]
MNLISNIKYTSLSQGIKILSQLTGMLVFAKYLNPADFGIIAMTTVVVNFINIIRDIGTSASIIQRENVSHELKSSLFWLNTVIGSFLFFIMYAVSNKIALFFSSPDLNFILPLIAISLPINSCTSVHMALLERDSKFKIISIIEIFSSVLALISSIIAAMNNFGAYSIVIQMVVYSALSGIGFVSVAKFVPKFIFSIKEVKSIFNFSYNLVSFNFINYFSRNLDQIIIGRFYSSDILGAYSLAYRIMLFPVQNITAVLSRSLFPIMSRVKGDKRKSAFEYTRILLIILMIVPPLMVLVSFLSKDVINGFLGSKWSLVPDIIFWLAPTAILQSLVSTTGTIFMSYGKPNVLFKISLFNCIIQVSSFVLGAFFDIIVLAKFYFLANLIIFIPNMFISFKMSGVEVMTFLKKIAPILFSILIMIVVICSVDRFISELYFGVVLSTLLKSSFGIITYLIAIWFFLHKTFKDTMRAIY